MNIALPKKGFSGVEKKADTAAWTNNMAESMGKLVKDLNIYLVIKHTHEHSDTSHKHTAVKSSYKNEVHQRNTEESVPGQYEG